MSSMFAVRSRLPGPSGRRWAAWPADRQTSIIRLLEEHQRDLEQRAADVADRIRYLRRSGVDRGAGRPAGPARRGWSGDGRRVGRRPPARASGGSPVGWGRVAAGHGPLIELADGRRVALRQLAGPPEAPTLLLLHGWGGSAVGNWSVAMPALARHFHVVAPDLAGHDAEAVDDMARLLDALGLDRVIAVGYSLGSAVAHHLWRRYPERVDGLVLCAPAGVSRSAGVTGRSVAAAVVVTEQDRLIPPRRQLELARSLPGATVHRVDGNHFAFARYDRFVPALLDACRSVAERSPNGGTLV